MAIIIDNAKETLNFKANGKIIKKAKEGITINIISKDKLIIFWVFFVSQYFHIKARNDVRGIDAKIPAKIVECLAISVIHTTTILETQIQ